MRGIALVLALLAVFCAGCARGSRVRASQIAVVTSDALVEVLTGIGPEGPGGIPIAPSDPPLLRRGGVERAVVAVDVDAFVRMARGAVSERQFQEIARQVVERADQRLRRLGFQATLGAFPAEAAPDALAVALEPTTQETGSPQERAGGRARVLLLVRLTVRVAAGEIRARRDFFSGIELRPER